MNRPSCPNKLPDDIAETVRRALAEDLGGGDITAALIPAHKHAEGRIVVKTTGLFAAYRGRRSLPPAK